VFAPPDPHAQLQAIQAIEATHALAIDWPPFPSQQHPNPHVAEPRSRMGQVANAQL
jgi:hypothetical protein